MSVLTIVCLLLMVSYLDDHRANKPKAPARSSQGAILPTSLHAGTGAHRCPAAPGVVGTSTLESFKGATRQTLNIHYLLTTILMGHSFVCKLKHAVMCF